MSETPSNNSRISVSEDRLRLLFAEFKLDLLNQLNQYATKESLEKQSERIRKIEDIITGNVAVSKAQKYAIGLAIAIFIPIIASLVYIASTAVHGG